MAFLGSIGKTVQKVVQQVVQNPLKAATLVAAGPFAAAAAGKIQSALQGVRGSRQTVQTVMAAPAAQPGEALTTPYFPQQGPSPIYYQPPQDYGGTPSWDYSTSQPTSLQGTSPLWQETSLERGILDYLNRPLL